MRDLSQLSNAVVPLQDKDAPQYKAWLCAKTHSRLRHFFPRLRADVAELHRALARKSEDAAYWYARSAAREYAKVKEVSLG